MSTKELKEKLKKCRASLDKHIEILDEYRKKNKQLKDFADGQREQELKEIARAIEAKMDSNYDDSWNNALRMAITEVLTSPKKDNNNN